MLQVMLGGDALNAALSLSPEMHCGMRVNVAGWRTSVFNMVQMAALILRPHQLAYAHLPSTATYCPAQVDVLLIKLGFSCV